MQNLGNVYICGSPFVMSRTDAQNGLDMVFMAPLTNQMHLIYVINQSDAFDICD
jgi:hypothetical protein